MVSAPQRYHTQPGGSPGCYHTGVCGRTGISGQSRSGGRGGTSGGGCRAESIRSRLSEEGRAHEGCGGDHRRDWAHNRRYVQAAGHAEVGASTAATTVAATMIAATETAATTDRYCEHVRRGSAVGACVIWLAVFIVRPLLRDITMKACAVGTPMQNGSNGGVSV